MKILFLILLVWFIFIYDFKCELSNNKWKVNIEYHGLLWVFLDYYTIIKYHSNDNPMKWIKYVKTKKYGS